MRRHRGAARRAEKQLGILSKNDGRDRPGRHVAEGFAFKSNNQRVTNPRERPPGTLHEQPPPTYERDRVHTSSRAWRSKSRSVQSLRSGPSREKAESTQRPHRRQDRTSDGRSNSPGRDSPAWRQPIAG